MKVLAVSGYFLLPDDTLDGTETEAEAAKKALTAMAEYWLGPEPDKITVREAPVGVDPDLIDDWDDDDWEAFWNTVKSGRRLSVKTGVEEYS